MVPSRFLTYFIKTCFVLFFIFHHEGAKAQAFSIGAESGWISSREMRYPIDGYEFFRNSVHAALDFQYSLNPKTAVSIGFAYLQFGFQHPTCFFFEEGVKNKLVGKFDYLSLPLSVIYFLGKKNRIGIHAGTYLAFNLRAVQQHPEPIGGCLIYYVPDLKHVTQEVNFGFHLAASTRISERNKSELRMKLTYIKGLSNSFKNTNPGVNIERYFEAYTIGMTYRYKIY
jgi:hypothetical protein